MEATTDQESGSSFKTDFITATVDKTPFTTTPAKNFFAKWCEINDSIVPQFTSRDEWEQRGRLGILEKNNQGKQTLFLPSDLHLWEMIDVIKTVDHDTLANSPEKRDQRADQINELGQTFEKAGLYLSEYLPNFKKNNDNSKQIIQDIAQEFYQYGLSLQHKDKKTNEIPKDSKLSQQDKTKLDEWFLGKEVYQKRLSRLGNNPTEDQLEETRVNTLQVYFKALSKEGYKADGEKPWETIVGPAKHLQDKTREQITKAIVTPETEMKTAIFRRGVEKLVTEIKTNVLFWEEDLYRALGIKELKQELEEVRKTKDIVKISVKELEIAKKIQRKVSSFTYKENSNNPSEMIKTRVINCVGASILGGGLLDKVGIKYLLADLPGHSATVLITSDKKVYWQDFTPRTFYLNGNYQELTPYILKTGLSIEDLQQISDSGLSFTFKDFNPYRHIIGQNLRVTLFKPEIGLQSQILNNTGNALNNLGRHQEAIEAYKQAISVDPKYAYPYHGLGNALSNFGRHQEAIEAYKQAISVYHGLGNALSKLGRHQEAIGAYKQSISIDPEYAYPYHGLGNALSNLGRHQEAIEAYKQAISVDPKDAAPCNGLGNALSNLGRHQEAIEDYKQAISIDPKYASPYHGLGNALSKLGRYQEAIEAYKTFIELWKGDKYWTTRAKGEIEKLKQKQGI